MNPYEELAGGWELVSWTQTEECEGHATRTIDRTREFRPFHLDLTYPPAGQATGTLSDPNTGASSSFDWELLGNPARRFRFRSISGPFHRFGRTYDHWLNDAGDVLTVHRCWSETRTFSLTELSRETWVGTAVMETSYFLFRFGLPGIVLAFALAFGALPAWFPLLVIENLARRFITWLRGEEETVQCTICEEIVFRRRAGG